MQSADQILVISKGLEVENSLLEDSEPREATGTPQATCQGMGSAWVDGHKALRTTAGVLSVQCSWQSWVNHQTGANLDHFSDRDG